jgi:hypothetical protein
MLQNMVRMEKIMVPVRVDREYARSESMISNWFVSRVLLATFLFFLLVFALEGETKRGRSAGLGWAVAPGSRVLQGNRSTPHRVIPHLSQGRMRCPDLRLAAGSHPQYLTAKEIRQHRFIARHQAQREPAPSLRPLPRLAISSSGAMLLLRQARIEWSAPGRRNLPISTLSLWPRLSTAAHQVNVC